ncbi:hypothetical protein [Methylogaea oryzae]|nr:hypothetical protein [Methylogaea oryzae]
MEAVLMMHDRRHPGIIREYLEALTELPNSAFQATLPPKQPMEA